MKESDVKVKLYGDESHAHEIVSYGFLIVPKQQESLVELAFREVVSRYGLPPDTRIHCRTMFKAEARRKTNFRDFSTELIFRFLYELMTESYAAGARAWVGYLNTKTVPDILFFESKLNKGEKWDIRNLKNRMNFCYQAASAPLTHMIPTSCVEMIVDGDRTKIPYFGESRRADTLKGFFPVCHNNAKFSPHAAHGVKPLLLDLADLLAYSSARGLSTTALKNKDEFISIVKAVDPGYSEVVFQASDCGGEVFKVRAYDPADRVKSYLALYLPPAVVT